MIKITGAYTSYVPGLAHPINKNHLRISQDCYCWVCCDDLGMIINK